VSPLKVQVVAYAPTVFRHCQHCEVAFQGIGLGERIHRAEAADALPDDLTAEFQQLSDWIHGLLERHGPRLSISVIDAASVEGVWMALRHRLRRFPTVIVDGDRVPANGARFEAADSLIGAKLDALPATAPSGGRKEEPQPHRQQHD
jgi:hypothetical protein